MWELRGWPTMPGTNGLIAKGTGSTVRPLEPTRTGWKKAAERVSIYVNEHLAHDAAMPRAAELPTFNDLYDAIDAISSTFQKYAGILNGTTWVLEPVLDSDWRAIFRMPWINL